MLENTFLHLSGIGKSTMQKLTDAGICTWADALNCSELPLRTSNTLFKAELEESYKRMEAKDALWFSEKLPPSEQWRLFPHFKDKAAYVDIETSGLSYPQGQITCIALYDSTNTRVYVQGRNLDDFVRDIEEYNLLVTWNGRCFDAPFMRKYFNIPLRMAHLDLFPVFRALGIKGGLKKVEKMLGLDRDGLDGVDGYMAILLWNEFMASRDESVLETLLAYNAEDVFSLEILGYYACEQLGCPLGETPRKKENPFQVDVNLVQRLLDLRMRKIGR